MLDYLGIIFNGNQPIRECNVLAINMENVCPQSSFCFPSVFQVKDAREKLVQKDARFKIRGRGGAGGVQDARQMINSRKQGQSQFSVPAQTTQMPAGTHKLQSQALVPQIQIHTNNSLASVSTRQFAPNVQGLGVRGSAMPQMSNNKRMMDARDRLSLKRSIGGTQTQTAAAPPLKITKTIQVRLKRSIFIEDQWHSLHVYSLKRKSTLTCFLYLIFDASLYSNVQ